MEQTKLGDLLKVLDDQEVLTDVVPFAYSELPEEIAALRLQFSRTRVFVQVQADYDALQIVRSAPGDALECRSIVEHEPWSSALRRPLLWAWRLVNHQGYVDGIQLAFYERQTGAEAMTIQLMGRASTIGVSCLQPVTTALVAS